MRMKQKIVGTYRLGPQMIQIVLRRGTSCEVFALPDDIPYPRLEIGTDWNCWRDIVGLLVHESAEHVASMLFYRFGPCDTDGLDRKALLFLMTHHQFSEVCARVGFFLAECLPDVEKAWKKWKVEK